MADDNFVGEIILTPYNFAPKGYAMCNGQLLPIAQNQALFALLGTTYGGNGFSTFGLPDLRGRVPLHFGQGPGLLNYIQGQTGGQEQVVLTSSQLGGHSHRLLGTTAAGDQASPSGASLAASAAGDGIYTAGLPSVTASPSAVAPAGAPSAAGHENRMPSLALNYCIALVGIFPSRD